MALIKTAPCPRCGSFRTQAEVKDGQCIVRGCESCSWMWDFADGRPANYAELAKPVAPDLGGAFDFEAGR